MVIVIASCAYLHTSSTFFFSLVFSLGNVTRIIHKVMRRRATMACLLHRGCSSSRGLRWTSRALESSRRHRRTSSRAFTTSSSASLSSDWNSGLETKSSRISHPPNFDFTALVASISHVSSKLPLKVTSCVQLDPHTLTVHLLSTDSERVFLQCSSHPDFARACVVPSFEASTSILRRPRKRHSSRYDFSESVHSYSI